MIRSRRSRVKTFLAVLGLLAFPVGFLAGLLNEQPVEATDPLLGSPITYFNFGPDNDAPGLMVDGNDLSFTRDANASSHATVDLGVGGVALSSFGFLQNYVPPPANYQYVVNWTLQGSDDNSCFETIDGADAWSINTTSTAGFENYNLAESWPWRFVRWIVNSKATTGTGTRIYVNKLSGNSTLPGQLLDGDIFAGLGVSSASPHPGACGSGAHAQTLAVDDNYVSGWQGSLSTASYMYVDQGVSPLPVSRVRVRQDRRNYTQAYTIDSSDDASIWANRATVTGITVGGWVESVLAGQVTARYWRVKYSGPAGVGSDRWQINHFAGFAEAAVPTATPCAGCPTPTPFPTIVPGGGQPCGYGTFPPCHVYWQTPGPVIITNWPTPVPTATPFGGFDPNSLTSPPPVSGSSWSGGDYTRSSMNHVWVQTTGYDFGCPIDIDFMAAVEICVRYREITSVDLFVFSIPAWVGGAFIGLSIIRIIQRR